MSRLARLIRRQAEACRELGSPLYGALLTRLADDVGAGGPGAAVLAGHEDDPGDDLVPLRLMGGVHRLVLEGKADDLGRFYPPSEVTPTRKPPGRSCARFSRITEPSFAPALGSLRRPTRWAGPQR